MDLVVSPVDIGGRLVGPGQPCFLVAEAGVNHNGSVELARRLVDAAADAGADAVKFQTFVASRLVTAEAPKAEYQRQGTEPGESQYEMLRRLELSADAHRVLSGHAAARGILFLSTPFDGESADLLEELGVPAFKIASGELTNVPFLAHVARKGRPMIMSTGMASLEEVDAAVRVIREAGNPALVLLHCVSNYPADPADANLRALATMAGAFSVPVGYSDHTLGTQVALAAVALGACVVEKHLTLDRTLPGPDHRSSLEPAEFGALVSGVRVVERALGDGCKRPAASEAAIAAVARRSLVAAVDIPEGAILTGARIAVRRPGTGLPPGMLAQVVGRRAKRDIPVGTLLSFEMLG